MKNYIKKPFDWGILSRLAMTAAAVTIIVLALPRNENQTFMYEVGMPWMYSTFTAKFDFPIYKSDEAYKHECDSALALFQPYFTIDATVEKRQVEKLENDYKDGIPGLPEEYLRIITNRLHRIYQAGVMDMQEYNNLAQDSTRQVRIINGRETESRYINHFYSTRTAYTQMFIDDELGEHRQTLQKCNLNDYIEPNIIYDKQRTESERSAMLEGIAPTRGIVKNGQKIIDRGELVEEKTAAIIKSFEKEKKRRNMDTSEKTVALAGQTIFVALIFGLFLFFVKMYRADYFLDIKKLSLPYLLIVLFSLCVSFMMRHTYFSVYIIPFCITPVFVRIFLDSRTAFLTHVSMVLICAIAVNYQYEFIIVQLVAGMAAVFSLRELSQRSQVLITALYVTIASYLAYLSLMLMQSTDLFFNNDMYLHICISGVLLLVSYPLMYVVERIYGFTSEVTFFELSDTNKGVLLELSEVAPGTFQHSVSVGNLAAEIARKIGAKIPLVRTGALYHDIGKIENPAYFTENQKGMNPHDKLTNMQSAKTIINHVTDGIRLAERYDLPQDIKDFILTHHGIGVAKYFYNKEKNEHPDTEVDIKPFTYPGHNPVTKEQAILMMADTVEAASRSLATYSDEAIAELVNRLVDAQVADGYFKESPITFRDITTAKKVMIEKLKTVYHTRIAYPELKK